MDLSNSSPTGDTKAENCIAEIKGKEQAKRLLGKSQKSNPVFEETTVQCSHKMLEPPKIKHLERPKRKNSLERTKNKNAPENSCPEVQRSRQKSLHAPIRTQTWSRTESMYDSSSQTNSILTTPKSSSKVESRTESMSQTNIWSQADSLSQTNSSKYPSPKYSQINNEWPENFNEIISELNKRECPPPQKSQFKFEMTHSAAEHNWETLVTYKNLGDAISASNNSHLQYGSEFRPTSELRPLLQHHPLWNRLKSILENGVKFPLEPISQEQMVRDLEEAVKFGNHKGAQKHSTFLKKLITEEIKHGYALIIPLLRVQKIPKAAMSPLNIIEQDTLTAFGEYATKMRLTHNQSMVFEGSNSSINSRVKSEELQDCMFGHCLLRIIHLIISFRSNYPKKRIGISKIDFKSAYRRAHLNWETAIQAITQFEDFAMISLRCTFGGRPCPNEWSIISETICDLTNAVLENKDWDPKSTFPPDSHLIPDPRMINDDIPFEPSLPLIVDIPRCITGKADVYIDDIISIILDMGDNLAKGKLAAALAVHLVSRHTVDNEPIPRHPMISIPKLEAEGAIEETKIVLGWKLDTRRLLISLPDHKANAWKAQIDTILLTKKSTFKQLESLLGRLTHVSMVLKSILHFLSRIRSLMLAAKNRRFISLQKKHVLDLTLLKDFITSANKGINMNLLTFRRPSHCYRSDACPWGLGGFSNQGRAWRFEIPKNLLFRATLNMLEFLACVVCPWVDILEGDIPPLSCFLSMTDSSTSAGWLKKSNFPDDNEEEIHFHSKLELARTHADRVLKADIKDYSQWFPGAENDLADSLSRDFHIPDKNLVPLYKSFIPKQVPKNLRISPLPTEIELWICAWLRKLPARKPPQEIRQRSKLAHGRDGFHFCNPSASKTVFSMTSESTRRQSFSEPSHTHYEKVSILEQMSSHWLLAQSELPSTMWHRPSGTISLKIPDSTQTKTLADFYSNSMKATKKRIHQKNVRKQYLSQSSERSTRTGPHPCPSQSDN